MIEHQARWGWVQSWSCQAAGDRCSESQQLQQVWTIHEVRAHRISSSPPCAILQFDFTLCRALAGLYTRGTLVNDAVIGAGHDEAGWCSVCSVAPSNKADSAGTDPRGQFIMCLWEQDATGRWGHSVNGPEGGGGPLAVQVGVVAFDCSTCTLVWDWFRDNALRAGLFLVCYPCYAVQRLKSL